ncbi:myosin XV-like protein [Sarcoptes scabiei]|uniref:Myosin XV-like protein n=1 Tax=Sarcoptes scabiei TaxID=52283 RepID=A0A131ZYV6_SARSC|nr:myosin XV-like protein [Sarcoptes scabiei]
MSSHHLGSIAERLSGGESNHNAGTFNGNFSLLQFALFNFRESLTKYDLRGHLKETNNSIRGSIKLIENLKTKRKTKSKNGSEVNNDWTWSEFANLVKYSKTPIQASLLMLQPDLNKIAIECFTAIMRYMGDVPIIKNQNEVDCVYTILLNCHRYAPIRDEVYCQIMKQTTSNKSARPFHSHIVCFLFRNLASTDPYTMPLNRDEYILDVTTELLKNGQLFYLIFCRSVWYYPLKLDSHLYIEVVFNQVAPDYLEGLLIIIPGENLPEENVEQISRIASLLHRAAEMEQIPTKDEVKYLLPKPVLALRSIKPSQWVDMVRNNWNDMSALSPIEAKAQCLDILQRWPLFGSCFFAVKRIQNDFRTHLDHILALNKDGVHFLDMVTHEKVWRHPYSEVISTRKVRSEDGTLYLDMKCGNLMVQKITRIQTDQV